MPVPTELQLHYGIEIEHGIPGHDLIERVVEIIGYQESRYFRQIWHYQRYVLMRKTQSFFSAWYLNSKLYPIVG